LLNTTNLKKGERTMSKIEKLIENIILKELGEETKTNVKNPMVGRRCLIRTYSAGVHIGDVVSVSDDGMQVHLKDSIRLWKWEGGGLSLSVVANDGIKGGRLNKTGEVFLTNAIEFIPTTTEAEKTYVKFIED
jgi:hypothetical protein